MQKNTTNVCLPACLSLCLPVCLPAFYSPFIYPTLHFKHFFRERQVPLGTCREPKISDNVLKFAEYMLNPQVQLITPPLLINLCFLNVWGEVASDLDET